MATKPIECISCGVRNGEPRPDGLGDAVVSQIKIIPRHNRPLGAIDGYGELPLCDDCNGRTPYDFVAVVKAADDGGKFWSNTEFAEIVRQIIMKWNNVEPITYSDVARILNEMGYLSQRGVEWSYHNIRQKMLLIGVAIPRIGKGEK